MFGDLCIFIGYVDEFGICVVLVIVFDCIVGLVMVRNFSLMIVCIKVGFWGEDV